MSNDKVAATGYEDVRPHQGWESFAAWGRTDEIPPPDDVLEGYAPAGPPPWVEPPVKKLPTWVWVLAMVAGTLFVVFLLAAAWFAPAPPPVPIRPIPTVPINRPVQVLGECKKQIIGHYGLIASVTATNPSDKPATGTVWVRWPVTGDEDRVFVKTFTIPAHGSADFHVNQPVDADLWYRTGQCTYTWTTS